MQIKIQKMKLTDVDSIFELGSGVSEFEVSDAVVDFWPKSVLENCVKNNEPIFVAKNGDEIVGFIIANYNKSFSKAIIENIFVSKDYRGKGIGERLLDKVFEFLKKDGCEYICSITEKNSQSAIDFYIKNEFNKGIECIWLDKIMGDEFVK